MVKRPGHAAAAARLALVRPSVTLPVPEVHLVEGAPLWSWHVMLPEEPLLPQDHPALSKVAKAGFARDPGRFLAEVHRIPVAGARAAVDLSPWGGAGDVAALLPEGLRAAAHGVVAQYAALPPDPCAAVFGQFAGHGWRRCAGACRGCIP